MPESWKTRLSRWGFNWFPAKIERLFTIELADETGEMCATCEKLLSIRPRGERTR
jgi:hypothetical protein